METQGELKSLTIPKTEEDDSSQQMGTKKKKRYRAHRNDNNSEGIIPPTIKKEFYGDKLINKNEDELRIAFININGIPATNDDSKNIRLFEAIAESQIDIIGMTEINRCWHNVEEEHKWRNRTRGWWESSNNTIGYNTKDCASGAFQPGGTLLTSIDKPAHRIIDTGLDPTGLGRWVWQRYRGKHNVTLRVICAYRPCIPSTAGPNTTYSQQERYFDATKDKRCPRDAILEDLSTEIKKWQEDNDQIIMMMDCNESINSGQMKMWAQQLGLEELITKKHSNEKPTATYNRGRECIDGIFGSASIHLLRGGHLAHGIFPSDHCLLHMDITYANAFGYKMPKIVKPPGRRLKCNDPRVKKRWQQHYYEFAKEHNIESRIFYLESIAQRPLSPAQGEEYTKLLRLKKQGIEYADKRCRKLRMGAVPFSDKLKEAGTKLALWEAVVTKKTGTKYSMNKLRRMEKTVGLTNTMHVSIEQAKKEVTEAKAQYNATKAQAETLRQTFLHRKAKDIAHEKDLPEYSVYKQLISGEEQRQAARRIKYTLQKIHGGGVSRVEMKDNDGTTKVLTQKVEIEEACMKENEKKYMQTSNTPCMTGQLQRDLGYDGLTPSGEAILNGTYEPPPGTGQYTRELLQQLKMVDTIFDTVPEAKMTTTQFREGWKKIKEQTSAGISGTHFGHLKACAEHPKLAEMEASFSHIPYMSGFSPSLWQYGVIVMIRKKANSDLLNHLRSVVLTEAEWNFNNKVLGKTTLEHAEKHNLLPKEQYGSRKGKSSIEHVLNKRLVYDILRQSRRPGLLCSNDAKSCFDRVVHSVAMLAYKRLGIPEPPVECMLKTIQVMKHHIRTTFGDSAFTIDREGVLVPYQGLLQGNGASPATWVIISAPLIEMMRSAQNGGFFEEAISGERHHIVGFAFVDDTDIIDVDMRDDKRTLEDAAESMQTAIHRWEGGLKATGGAIRPDKSWIYPIGFSFDTSGKWSYIENTKEDFDFKVRDENEDLKSLPIMEANEGKETLGVYLAPDGNNADMIKYLQDKTLHWKELIRSGHLSKKDARQALNTTIMKSIEYALPALTLTEQECKKIMKPILEAGLPNMGICRNYPRNVLHGPIEEGGMNIPNIFTFQGTSRLTILQEHLSANTLTGELLRTSIEAAQIEIGVGRNIFLLDYDLYECLLTDCWIKHVWAFAFHNNITIHDNTTQTLDLQRENDLYLMEIIIESRKYTKSELQQINRCRLHLQVYSLTDITCGFGETFTNTYKCEKDQQRPQQFKWPIQPKPGKKAKALWKKALKDNFPRDEQHVLLQPLQRWTSPCSKWRWYFNPHTNTLFQRYSNGSWRSWRRRSTTGRVGRTPNFVYDTQTFNTPRNIVRATVQRIDNRIIKLTGWDKENINTISSIIPRSIQWVSTDNNITAEDELAIIQAIQQHQLILVSDGSYIHEERLGTAGWIAETQDRMIQIHGALIAPGPADIQGSHRSELTGLLGGITTIDNICRKYNVTEGSVEVGCDGEGAITAITQQFDIIKTSRKHYDLIQAIKNTINKSKLAWSFQHIKGHQDDIREYDELSRLEQLNVQADLLAKRKMTALLSLHIEERKNYRHNHLPNESCYISWNNAQGQELKICSHLQKTLTFHIEQQRLRQHWKKKNKFSPYAERSLDWTVIHKSHKGTSPAFHQWLSKWITGFCGVGVMMKLWKFQNHDRCPRCNAGREDTTHVLQCPQPEAVNLWQEEMEKLDTWLTDNKAHPDLQESIILNLQAWHDGTPFPSTKFTNDHLDRAIRKQDSIGWRNFIDGFIPEDWRLCQTMVMAHTQKSPHLWMAKLQRKIWQIAWTMWEHRNKHLHGENSNNIHQYDLMELDTLIIAELAKGMDNLPRRYRRLFQQTPEERQETTIIQKRQWLSSVWAAREHHSPSIVMDRTVESGIFYTRWKNRLENTQN